MKDASDTVQYHIVDYGYDYGSVNIINKVVLNIIGKLVFLLGELAFGSDTDTSYFFDQCGVVLGKIYYDIIDLLYLFMIITMFS